MPPGLRTCLPRGCVPASVGSQTPTTISCSPSALECVGDVERERVVAARWLPSSLPLTLDGRLPVDGPEMQQDAPARSTPAGTANVRRYQRRLSWPTGFITPDRADSTGNGTRILPSNALPAGCALGLGRDGVVPQAVEVLPVLADHLRPRVLGQGVVGRNVLRPPGHERPLGRLPLRRSGRRGRRRPRRIRRGGEAGEREGDEKRQGEQAAARAHEFPSFGVRHAPAGRALGRDGTDEGSVPPARLTSRRLRNGGRGARPIRRLRRVTFQRGL